MSVDQRLQEAFHADDDWVPEVPLSTVQTTARPAGDRTAAYGARGRGRPGRRGRRGHDAGCQHLRRHRARRPSPTSSATPSPTDAPLAFEDT